MRDRKNCEILKNENVASSNHAFRMLKFMFWCRIQGKPKLGSRFYNFWKPGGEILCFAATWKWRYTVLASSGEVRCFTKSRRNYCSRDWGLNETIVLSDTYPTELLVLFVANRFICLICDRCGGVLCDALFFIPLYFIPEQDLFIAISFRAWIDAVGTLATSYHHLCEATVQELSLNRDRCAKGVRSIVSDLSLKGRQGHSDSQCKSLHVNDM